MGDLTVFNNNYMATMQRFADLVRTIDELKQKESEIRDELFRAMQDYNIVSIDNEVMKATRVAPSKSITIDVKALRMRDPDTYEKLLEEYPKTTVRRESLRITLR